MNWSELAGLAQEATQGVFCEESALYDGASVRMIFDEAFVQAGLDGVSVESVGPVGAVVLADLPMGRAEQGKTVVVRNREYTVVEVHPDGHGTARLRLRVAS